MQVLSRRQTASSLGCNSELGFTVSLVKALVRNLKGVDTVPVSYCCDYLIVLQTCLCQGLYKGGSYPTAVSNPTDQKPPSSRHSLQHFQQQSCFHPYHVLDDRDLPSGHVVMTFHTSIPLICLASTSQTQWPDPCQKEWWKSPQARPWGSARGAPP